KVGDEESECGEEGTRQPGPGLAPGSLPAPGPDLVVNLFTSLLAVSTAGTVQDIKDAAGVGAGLEEGVGRPRVGSGEDNGRLGRASVELDKGVLEGLEALLVLVACRTTLSATYVVSSEASDRGERVSATGVPPAAEAVGTGIEEGGDSFSTKALLRLASFCSSLLRAAQTILSVAGEALGVGSADTEPPGSGEGLGGPVATPVVDRVLRKSIVGSVLPLCISALWALVGGPGAECR
ncbi:unnamed protein product, partial [Discosporangium mesarthrocarpum]